MEKYRVVRDGAPDCVFTGEMLGEVVHAGRRVRALYKTAGGKYVCVEFRNGRSVAKVAEDIDGVTGFFGFGFAAKKLYDQCGIVTDIEVE